MSGAYQPLKAYVAARYDDRELAAKLKEKLEARGVVVTSTWLTPDDNQSMNQLNASKNKVAECRMRAIKDFEDIDEADVFVVISKPEGFRNGTGGKHVEMGYAMATGVPVFVVGERENIFHYHPTARLCATEDQLFIMLGIGEPTAA